MSFVLSLPHISLDFEKMFRGSTTGSPSSDDELHGYVTQTEFVGLRHLVRATMNAASQLKKPTLMTA